MLKNIDVVIHAAGINRQECYKNPAKNRHTSALLVNTFANIAKANGVIKYLYLSSVSVYKPNLSGIITEQSATVDEDPYDYSHLAAEKEIMQLTDRSFTPCVLRVSNVFGIYKDYEAAGMWNNFINSQIRNLVIKGKIEIKNDPATTRDFLPINLFLQIFERLALNNFEIRKPISNITSGQQLSLSSIAQKIRDVAEKDVGINNIEIHKKSNHLIPAAKRISSTLNFEFSRATICDAINYDIANLIRYCMKSNANK